MFGIGFFEIVIVLLVAVLLFDADQMKEYTKLLRIILHKIKRMRETFADYIHSLEDTSYVLGKDGKMHKSYNLEKEKNIDDSTDIGS